MKTEYNTIYYSIIIPTYNRQAELIELLNCLNKQKYKNFEILICDDGSTDNTQKAITCFINELDIQYFYLNNSGGPASPRNFGISKAKYDWICFVDSDDLWTSNKLEVLSNYILRYPKYDIFCHPVYILQNNTISSKIIGNYKKGIMLSDFKSLLYNGSQIVNSSLCVRRSIITNELNYNTSSEYHGIEDYIFLLSLTKLNYKIKKIKFTLGYYRLHKNNISADNIKQLNKLKLYFSSTIYYKINSNKINNLIIYIELLISKKSNFELLKSYSRIIFSHSSIEIKLKSIFKIFNLVKK